MGNQFPFAFFCKTFKRKVHLSSKVAPAFLDVKEKRSATLLIVAKGCMGGGLPQLFKRSLVSGGFTEDYYIRYILSMDTDGRKWSDHKEVHSRMHFRISASRGIPVRSLNALLCLRTSAISTSVCWAAY